MNGETYLLQVGLTLMINCVGGSVVRHMLYLAYIISSLITMVIGNVTEDSDKQVVGPFLSKV
jgi:hypothetical protein